MVSMGIAVRVGQAIHDARLRVNRFRQRVKKANHASERCRVSGGKGGTRARSDAGQAGLCCCGRWLSGTGAAAPHRVNGWRSAHSGFLGLPAARCFLGEARLVRSAIAIARGLHFGALKDRGKTSRWRRCCGTENGKYGHFPASRRRRKFCWAIWEKKKCLVTSKRD